MHATMDMRRYERGQDNKLKNKEKHTVGGNRKESPGNESEVVWAVDEKKEHHVRRGWKCEYRG